MLQSDQLFDRLVPVIFLIGLTIAAVCGCGSATTEPKSPQAKSHKSESLQPANSPPPTRNVIVWNQKRTDDQVRAAIAQPMLDEQPIPTPLPNFATTAALDSRRAALRGDIGPAQLPQLVPTVVPQPIAAISIDGALRQIEELNARGFASYAKGAWFSARSDFQEALRQAVAALDARESSEYRSRALTDGMTALTEAEDFCARSARLNARVDLGPVLKGHRTSAYVTVPAGATPAAVHDLYIDFAKRQLAEAAAGARVASIALHGLGKVCAAMNDTAVDARGKARAFYEAALTAAPANFLAANDLAVLLAEEGRYEQARNVLHAGLLQSPQPAMWLNLAVVQERLGRPQLAQLARQEAAVLQQAASAGGRGVLPTHNVAWLDPQSFAATNRPLTETQAPLAATTTVATSPGSAVAAEAPLRAASPTTQTPAAAPRPQWAQRPKTGPLSY